MKERFKGKRLTLDLCYSAASVALIAVCSWISIPVSDSVKYTLQLLAVFTCCGLLGITRGFVSVAVYVAMGCVGIPVFAGFSAGFSPTTGFVIGFLPAAVVVGCGRFFACKKAVARCALQAVLMLVGLLLCYAVGTLWFMAWTKYDFLTTIAFTVMPYYFFDLIKIALSVVLVGRLQKRIR